MFIDLRHLLRNLRRSPASAGAAVLTLALTLGAGTAIFAVVDAVLLTPPPFSDPDALVTIGEARTDDRTLEARPVRYATFEAWRARAGGLAQIEAYDTTNLTLTELGSAERLSATDVTPGFLATMGVAPWRGRLFEGNDLGRPVAIVSHVFWRTKLAADPGAIGRQVVLGGRAHTVVGVLPERFAFALNRSDVWRPLPLPPTLDGRAAFRVRVVARRGQAVPLAELRAALDEVSRTGSPPMQAVVTPLDDAIAGPATRTLGLLAGAAAVALLIAFANLAALLLLRAIDRRRELAVRTALGARPSEIARQLLLEAGTLVAMGIAGGVLLAFWLTPVAGHLALDQFGAVANREVAVSWRGIGVITVISAVCGGICGVLPALVASRHSVVNVLRRGVTPAPGELGWRRLFVIGEVALACVLLVSLALVGRSLQQVLAVDPGFDARGVLTLQVSVPTANYPTAARVSSFYSALHGALQARMGPGTVAVVSEMPLTGDRGRRLVRLRPTDAGSEVVERAAGTDYFDVMRMAIVAGRPFDASDDAAAPPRVVVSESLAARLFGRERAVGRQILVPDGGNSRLVEVIGIAGDVKHRALDETFLPTMYLSAWQSPSRSSILVVRSPRPPAEVMATVREEVARLDRSLPVYRVRAMPEVVSSSPGVPARRVLTATFLGFALLAIVLGGIGLFGVVAHDVASRRAELAIRLALGAAPIHIIVAPIRQAALMVAAGLAVGGVLSIWATRALGGLVFATGSFDLLSFGLAAACLMLVGAIAVLPAVWRAASTDPLGALRGD